MTTVNPKVFKAYDIRGFYPQDIDEGGMADIVKAIYSFFIKNDPEKPLTVVLGRDMRLSGPALFEVAKKALVDCGATVIDIGLTSTPTMYFAVMKYRYDAGIQITASHNPKDYTGIKYLRRSGDQAIKISKNTGMLEVKDRVLRRDFIKQDSPGKIISRPHVLKDEVKDALSYVRPPNRKRLKVAIDPANGMGIEYTSELFHQYPADLVKLNFKLDGSFPAHQPDPLQFQLLKDLQETVVQEKADLGIAPDGDGDRVFFIDEKGVIVPATLIASLIAKEILEEKPGAAIVADIRYLRNVVNALKKYGGRLSVSPVGHALITEQVNRENAVFAGESSGHFYFGDLGGAESALRVVAYVLKAIQTANQPLSKILAPLKTNCESGEFNYVLPEALETKTIFDQLTGLFPDGQANRLDGLAIDYPAWRFGVRTSNTEPLLRLNVEGENESLVKEKLKQIQRLIIQMGGKAK